jgi:hypothetical protein
MESSSQIISLTKRLDEWFVPSLNPLWQERSEHDFESLAIDLFRFQYGANGPYRALCDARSIHPGSVEHWSRIPAVTTSLFRDFDFSCLAPSERTQVFHSSGTTEQRPSRHFHGQASLGLYERSLLAFFEHVLCCLRRSANSSAPGVGNPLILVSLTPPLRRAPNSSLVYMFDGIGRRFASRQSVFLGELDRAGAWILDHAILETELRTCCAARVPIFLCGTAFLFVRLLDLLADTGRRFELPPGSIILETGGYKGRSRAIPRPDLHALLCDRLGVSPHRILCEYGMCELSSQAYSTVATDDSVQSPRVFRFPPWARPQIICPETGGEVAEGEIGLLRILDLANVWSVAAIQTEDLALRRGSGFELIGRAHASEPRGCSIMAGRA